MTTLFDILKKVYLDLGHLEVSTATGGAKSYITDTKLGEKYGDDDIIGNIVFIIKADGAAPEGEASYVSSYVQSTNTINISPALTVAVASGDRYGLAKNIITLETMKSLVNNALQSMGTIQLADTSLTTIADTSEYPLPVALKYKVNGVQIQTNTSGGYNQWQDIGGWYIINSAAGSTGLLCFNEELPSGYTLKLLYESEHPEVTELTDNISETFHTEHIAAFVVDKALEYQIRRTGGTDPFLMQTSNKAMQDAENAKRVYSQTKRKKPKYITPYNFGDSYDNEG